jgi:hypothetical protein
MGAPYNKLSGLENFKMVCISCGKALGNEFKREGMPGIHPSGGLVLRASGNYGSTKFDPMSGRMHLRMFLCDECAEEKREHILIVYEFDHKVIEYCPWEESRRETGQGRADKMFSELDLESLFHELRTESKWDSEEMIPRVKKFFMQKMINDEFPLQNVLNVEVFLGPKENDIQLRIAIDSGVAFFLDEG